MFNNYTAFQKPHQGLKYLLMTMTILSLVSALSLRIPIFGTNLQSLLSFSSWGMHNHFYWQLITHLFVQPLGGEVTIFFLVHLFFNVIFLFFVGRTLMNYKDPKDFFKLFFASGLIAAFAGWGISSAMGTSFYLAGPSTAIYALLTVWAFFNPHQEVLFFLVVPIQVRYLLLAMLGSSLFLDLANGNLLGFTTCLAAVSTGYFFALLKYEIHSPYTFLHDFEQNVINKKRNLFRREKVEVFIDPKKSKVYDFKTGRVVLDDADFMDVCLEKISKYGKKSLTLRERFRMFRVSRRMSR